MKNKFRFLPQSERKNILLLCDDIRLHSGVGSIAREIVVSTAHHFNWLNIGAAIKHPERGKILDLSQEVNKLTGLEDSNVKVVPNDGYGDPMTIRSILSNQKIDAIFIFTDPRYWEWLFDIEREIRSKIPIFYLNIWDDYPSPLYNKTYYDSVDVLMAISKQTKNINKLVLGEKAKNKIIEYVPHGINEEMFFPIDEKYENFNKFLEFKKNLFPNKDIDFVVLFNSRNIRRKSIPDTILAYRHFCDMIGKEKAKKCALVLHTQPVDPNGTDLFKVKEAFCDPSYVNVYFSSEKLTTPQMNLLYNAADVNILLSSNEGWGLSLTEAMMAGKMIICNVTGGMQDQCRFENKNGEWIDFDSKFPSNHRGTVKKHGTWAVPVFPSNISVIGSVPTPYIFDDRVNPEDAAKAILEVYNLSPEERRKRGLRGREWVTSDESGMSTRIMAKNIIKCCDNGFKNFKPRQSYELIKVENQQPDYIKHELLNYSYE